MDNLDTTNWLLAVVAVASTVQTLLLSGLAVVGYRLFRQVGDVAQTLETRHVEPLRRQVDGVLTQMDEVLSEVHAITARISQRTERVDHAISGTIERVDGVLFACIAMCFTAITPSIDALNYPSFLFITPMLLFSGTFFPLSVLPELVQVLAVVLLPLTQLVQVSRSLTLTTLSPLFFYSLAWIAVATVFFFLLSILAHEEAAHRLILPGKER